MPSTEKEDLEALLQAPGWLRFANHAEQEWQTNLHDRLASAIADKDDKLALEKMRQVIVAKKAIEQLLRWPKERLDQLTRAADNYDAQSRVPLSRRGTL